MIDLNNNISLGDITSIFSIIGIAGTLIVTILRFNWKFAQLNLKVETLWDFQLRRASVEAVDRGFATIKSPVTVTIEAKSFFSEKLTKSLQDFYQKLGRHISDRQLAREIEVHFGEQIVKEVCIPQRIHHGACLIIALAIAKNTEEAIDIANLNGVSGVNNF